jgi:hypothetical protein
MTTSILRLPELIPSTAERVLTNTVNNQLEAFCTKVQDFLIGTPPLVIPAHGYKAILDGAPTGIWAAYPNHIVLVVVDSYVFIPPSIFLIDQESAIIPGTSYRYNGTTWDTVTAGSGGGAGAATDLTLASRTAATIDIISSSGTDVTLPAATTTLAGLMTAADKVALASGGGGGGGSALNNVIVSDSFSYADGSNLLGRSTEIGQYQYKKWFSTQDDFVINNGFAFSLNSAANSGIGVDVGIPSYCIEVIADVTSSAAIGVFFRSTLEVPFSVGSSWHLSLSSASTNQLLKYSGGIATVIDSIPIATPTNSYSIVRVFVTPTDFIIQVNGFYKRYVNTDLNSNTGAGIQIYQNLTTAFDSIKVYDSMFKPFD